MLSLARSFHYSDDCFQLPSGIGRARDNHVRSSLFSHSDKHSPSSTGLAPSFRHIFLKMLSNRVATRRVREVHFHEDNEVFGRCWRIVSLSCCLRDRTRNNPWILPQRWNWRAKTIPTGSRRAGSEDRSGQINHGSLNQSFQSGLEGQAGPPDIPGEQTGTDYGVGLSMELEVAGQRGLRIGEAERNLQRAEAGFQDSPEPSGQSSRGHFIRP